MQDFVFFFCFLNIVSLFAVFEAKPIWQHARKNIQREKKQKTQHGKIYTLASKKKVNTSSEVRVQASKKLKKQGFGRCT